MKVAFFGVWHVHVHGYVNTAREYGEIVGFYERNDKLAEEFSKAYGIPRFNTPEELLASEAEGVIVCSATCDHANDIIMAAKAGKHIFAEKVLALTDADCDRVEAAVNESGVKFAIALFEKYNGSRMLIKQVASSGELGKLNFMRIRMCHSGSTRDWLPEHFYNARECGGGAMIDEGAHGMYLIEWVLGTPITARSAFTVSCELESVKAKNTDGLEDNAVTVMTFEGGAIAINEAGFVSNRCPATIEVFGENGFVRLIGNRAVKCTDATDGKEVELEIPENKPLPLVQFLTDNILDGCGMREAKALTHMMTMAYGK